MTNGDRIRQMTDEELAIYLECPYTEKPCRHSEDAAGCAMCIEEWLKQEEKR